MASSVYMLVTFLSVVLVVLVDAGGDLSPENKIVGGKEVDISQFPWQAALLLRDQFICGGIIINDYWIISAAHCVLGEMTHSLKLRVGSNAYGSGGQIYQVERLAIHENYSYTGHNDISAMKATLRIAFGNKVGAVILPTSSAPPVAVGSDVFISGWGRTSRTSKQSPNLMAAEIKVANFSVCESLYKIIKPVESLQICAGSDGLNCCYGDSGGPLVSGNVLVGIVSYGPMDCGNHPAIYTRVSAYRHWIKKHTGF